MGIDISGSLKKPYPLRRYTPSDTVLGVYGGLWKKFVNAKDALERNDTMRTIEFASPSFLEAILKAYRMADQGATTAKGKIITDEQGKPIRLSGEEVVAQAIEIPPGKALPDLRVTLDDGQHRSPLRGSIQMAPPIFETQPFGKTVFFSP